MDLDVLERHRIGNALRHKIAADLDNIDRTWVHPIAAVTSATKALGLTTDEIKDALDRELLDVKSTWLLYCRFCKDPLPWEFFLTRIEEP